MDMSIIIFVAIVVAIYVILSRLGSALNKKMTDEAMDAFDSISDHINKMKHEKNNKGR
ncbi:hypothetical protein SAMN02910353_02811 [Ruminococcus sp. YRD2003]|nr:hypothetical protein SAMN02910353_02811 [Ruminococcus flavefaciens]